MMATQPRRDKGLWFCWICRKPLHVIHGQCRDSTQFQVWVSGRHRHVDCHDECYHEYSEGFQLMYAAWFDWDAEN